MEHRERILELVKKGVISSEEALVLLENLTNKEVDSTTQKEQAEMGSDHETTEQSSTVESLKAQLQERADELARLRETITMKEDQYDTLEEGLEHLSGEERTKQEQACEKLEAEIDVLEDQYDELEDAYDQMQENLEALQETLKKARQSYDEQDEPSFSKKFDQFDKKVERFAKKFGRQAEKIGRQIEKKVESEEFKQKFSQFFQSVADALSSEKWQTRTKFERTYRYTSPNLSMLDIRNANGSVYIEQADVDEVIVEATVMLAKQLGDVDAERAFIDRSTIEATDDKLVFHVPNKHVFCQLNITLPRRQLDYLAVKVLNGKVDLSGLTGTDMYVKVTTGDIRVSHVTGTMLEARTVTGNIYIKGSQFKDVVAKAITGNYKTDSEIISQSFKTQSGVVLAKIPAVGAERFIAKTTSGSVTVYVPEQKWLSAKLSTLTGHINNRLAQATVSYEDNRSQSQVVHVERVTASDVELAITIDVIGGNVVLKDLEHVASEEDKT